MSDHAFNSGPVAAADLIQKVLETAKAALPESIANDVRDNLKAAIQDAMAGLDVVTREEFEVQ
ncbi:MAG: accessory factor UbiK family protein, partial [Acidiferrobacterales bacterium]|nr:accessory factor UbiK family protein [Acidiferrobacterales bacterium]